MLCDQMMDLKESFWLFIMEGAIGDMPLAFLEIFVKNQRTLRMMSRIQKGINGSVNFLFQELILQKCLSFILV